VRRTSTVFGLILFLVFFSGCFSVRQGSNYYGPAERPVDLEEYYAVGNSYGSFEITKRQTYQKYELLRIEFETDYGPVTIDYRKRPEKSNDLVFVFPVLGGRNIFSNYFADYFARKGFDTAIVHRDKDFKNPDTYERIEEVFRNNVIRDRIAMNFFEEEYGKKDFGAFGISRGAINAAVTAGVDSRLRYNVLAMGGGDIVGLFRDSGERGIQKYRNKVMERKNISEQQFYSFLYKTLRTDPKFVAGHIDARDTLMFLSLFDDSVPVKYGLKLRQSIGYPRTIFLLSGHYSSVAYTQFVKLVPPTEVFCIFPMDYVETESLVFYQEAFGRKRSSFKRALYGVLQIPFQVVGQIIRIFMP